MSSRFHIHVKRQAMRHWFKDQHFRSLLKNSSYLAASRIVAAIARLATVSLAAHALGVLLFGALILINSYARAVSGIAKFQSWQLIVRYGGHESLHGEHEDFKASTGFAFALDVVSGVGGMLVGVALLPFIATLGRDQPDQSLAGDALLHAAADHGVGDPDGVSACARPLRSHQLADTVTPISRVILVADRLSLPARPFIAYVAAWYVTTLAGDLYDWFIGWRELRRRGLSRASARR